MYNYNQGPYVPQYPAYSVNPYQQRLDSLTPMPRYEVIHINGRTGAEALPMDRDSQVIAMDDTAPMVWLIQTDRAGVRTCTPFDIARHIDEPPVDVNSLESRVKRLEEMLNGKQSNDGPAESGHSERRSERKSNGNA